MILCLHCKSPSMVVETREVVYRPLVVRQKKTVSLRTKTVRRRRQCKKCRFKWSTVEHVMHNRLNPIRRKDRL